MANITRVETVTIMKTGEQLPAQYYSDPHPGNSVARMDSYRPGLWIGRNIRMEDHKKV